MDVHHHLTVALPPEVLNVHKAQHCVAARRQSEQIKT
jgi:hypothetical protein